MKLRILKTCIVTFIFLAEVILVHAQKPAIRTATDKKSILIGEQFHYRVESAMPDDLYRLSWAAVPDSFGNFTVVIKNKIDSIQSGGNLIFSQSITLTSFDSGRQVVPPLSFLFESLRGDSSFTMMSDSVPVMVGYSPADSILPFHTIKNILEVKKQWPWWYWLILAAGLLFIIFWIWFLIRFFRKKKKTEVLFAAKQSPYDEAMNSLNELEASTGEANYNSKFFHTQLSAVFKRYLSRKTNTYQLHLTADELLIELKSMNVDHKVIQVFAGCLRMSNAVKFAKYRSTQLEDRECLSATKDTIIAIHQMKNNTPIDS